MSIEKKYILITSVTNLPNLCGKIQRGFNYNLESKFKPGYVKIYSIQFNQNTFCLEKNAFEVHALFERTKNEHIKYFDITSSLVDDKPHHTLTPEIILPRHKKIYHFHSEQRLSNNWASMSVCHMLQQNMRKRKFLI